MFCLPVFALLVGDIYIHLFHHLYSDDRLSLDDALDLISWHFGRPDDFREEGLILTILPAQVEVGLTERIEDVAELAVCLQGKKKEKKFLYSFKDYRSFQS